MTDQQKYHLPCHPASFCQDPLGLCGDSAAVVWDVIRAAIVGAAAHIDDRNIDSVVPDLIATLVYSLHGNGSPDLGGLRQFSNRNHPHSRDLCNNVFTAALSLPDVFPTHTLPYLSQKHPRISLSHQQINAILAHQLLGTLVPPPGAGWGSPTFLCWYKEQNPHPMAVEGYLTTLFDHFAKPLTPSSQVDFYLCHSAEADMWSDCDQPIHLFLRSVKEESEPSDTSGELPPPAVIISSNHCPGFGSSGTQEERLFSSSLYLCPIVLFCPSIPYNAALITSQIPVHAAWNGHNRTARLTSLFPRLARPNRSYILIDALELDGYDHSGSGLPDLANNHVERELRKVSAGCIGLRTMYPGHTPLIECGAWGCGAFGGDVVVKGILLAMASSCNDVVIQLTLLEDRREAMELIKVAIDAGLTVAQVHVVAMSEAAKICQDGRSFVRLLSNG